MEGVRTTVVVCPIDCVFYQFTATKHVLSSSGGKAFFSLSPGSMRSYCTLGVLGSSLGSQLICLPTPFQHSSQDIYKVPSFLFHRINDKYKK